MHEIEAFYLKIFKKIFPGGAYPNYPPDLEDVTFTPQLKDVHTIMNTFETFFMYITNISVAVVYWSFVDFLFILNIFYCVFLGGGTKS